MAKVYGPPEDIKRPQFEVKEPYQEFRKREDAYIEAVQSWAKAEGKAPESGKLIKFPVADGYAVYCVFTLKPVVLIHMPIGDAWQFQYANRLTASDIREEIRREDAIHALFSKKVNNEKS